nr:ABZJ_00895 family protein [Acinetobacter sp. Marseille-Q1620]
MKHYFLYFAAIYSIALVLLGLLFSILNLGFITTLPILLAAAFLTASHFVKKELRLPSHDEKIQLVWGSTATALVIACLLLFFYIVTNPASDHLLEIAEKTGLAGSAIIMLFIVIIHGGVFYLAYGWYANQCFQKLK